MSPKGYWNRAQAIAIPVLLMHQIHADKIGGGPFHWYILVETDTRLQGIKIWLNVGDVDAQRCNTILRGVFRIDRYVKMHRRHRPSQSGVLFPPYNVVPAQRAQLRMQSKKRKK